MVLIREPKPLNSLEEAYEYGFKMGTQGSSASDAVMFVESFYKKDSREANRFYSGYDCGRVTFMRNKK